LLVGWLQQPRASRCPQTHLLAYPVPRPCPCRWLMLPAGGAPAERGPGCLCERVLSSKDVRVAARMRQKPGKRPQLRAWRTFHAPVAVTGRARRRQQAAVPSLSQQLHWRAQLEPVRHINQDGWRGQRGIEELCVGLKQGSNRQHIHAQTRRRNYTCQYKRQYSTKETNNIYDTCFGRLIVFIRRAVPGPPARPCWRAAAHTGREY
jgi:hypothetical protein